MKREYVEEIGATTKAVTVNVIGLVEKGYRMILNVISLFSSKY